MEPCTKALETCSISSLRAIFCGKRCLLTGSSYTSNQSWHLEGGTWNKLQTWKQPWNWKVVSSLLLRMSYRFSVRLNLINEPFSSVAMKKKPNVTEMDCHFEICTRKNLQLRHFRKLAQKGRRVPSEVFPCMFSVPLFFSSTTWIQKL